MDTAATVAGSVSEPARSSVRCDADTPARRRCSAHAAHLLELAAAAVEARLPIAAGRFIAEFERLEPNDRIARTVDVAVWRKRAHELRGEALLPSCWAGCLCSCRPIDEEDPDILAIHRKLSTMKLDLGFSDTRPDDIVAFLRDFTGLNILLDAFGRDAIDLDRALEFFIRDAVLGDTLSLLAAELGLEWVVTEEKVLLLTTPQLACQWRGLQKCIRAFADHAPAETVLRMLREETGVRIAVEDGALDGTSVSLDEGTACAACLLDDICEQARVRWRLGAEGVTIHGVY